MADISKIKFGENTYDIKDSTARQSISDMQSSVTGAMHYIGTTTTALTDGATTATISIDGTNKTLAASDAGSVAIYGEREYVWNGTKWQEFGSTGSLKALAFKDSASGKFTPSGNVSQPSFTGTEGSVSVKGTPAGTISVGTGTANYTPQGTVSKPTFTGNETTSTGNFTPSGSVTISKGTGTANYTPEGTINVDCNTTTVNSITAVGTLPSCTLPTLSTSVENETLTLDWTAGTFSAGTLPTKGSNVTVATGIKTKTFTGTGVELKGAFAGTQGSVSVKGTPTGTVSQPTFTGTGKELKFTGSETTSTGKFTPSGSVSKPTFAGTEGNVSVS